MSRRIITFDGTAVDVTWNGSLCIHVGECGRAKGDLFVSGRDPWCTPDAHTVEEVVEIIERCPTGALSYRIEGDDAPVEQPDAANTAVVANHGPIYLRGALQIDGATDEMPGVATRAALCRCGKSKNKPFCDNTHEGIGFKDRGAVGDAGAAIEATGGPLVVERIPDGPFEVTGNLTIHAGSGRPAWTGTKAWLCRCGASKNKPFCDGSHTAIGFKAE